VLCPAAPAEQHWLIAAATVAAPVAAAVQVWTALVSAAAAACAPMAWQGRSEALVQGSRQLAVTVHSRAFVRNKYKRAGCEQQASRCVLQLQDLAHLHLLLALSSTSAV
jgi:uncharacterized protein (DUF2252 family)